MYTRLKNILYLFLLAVSLMGCQAQRELVWEENFNGDRISEENWNFDLGDGCPQLCGWGNNELQSYTKENHVVNNGLLKIAAKKENGIYTSTRITSKGKHEFKYGRIEIKAQLPIGKGLWPAFWMLGSNIDSVGWPLCGEIDILEYVGREPETIFTTLHTADSHGNSKNTRKDSVPGIEEGFHIYAIDWTEDKIDFFIDDDLFYSFEPKQKNKETWPFDQPFYIIVNLAVGGNFGGAEVDDTVLPQEFIVDYIKVYN